MKKLYILLTLISLSTQIVAKKRTAKPKKEICPTTLSWQPEEQCKAEVGGFIVSDNCCKKAEKIVGKKPGKDFICCADVTDEGNNPYVD